MLLSRALIETASVATDEDSRYCLDHLRIDTANGRVTASATNGHMLLSVSEPLTPDAEYPNGATPERAERTAPALIPAETLTAALKVAPKRPTVPVLGMVRIGDVDGAPVVQTTDLAQHFGAVVPEAAKGFPDISRVLVPADAPIVCRLGLSQVMLADLAKALKAFQDGRKSQTGGTLTLEIPQRALDSNGAVIGAVRITAHAGNRELTGCLMGVRV